MVDAGGSADDAGVKVGLRRLCSEQALKGVADGSRREYWIKAEQVKWNALPRQRDGMTNKKVKTKGKFQAYAYRGERAKAFDWLDRAVVQRDPGLINFKTDPLFAGLRGDARYKTVLRKMNLPE